MDVILRSRIVMLAIAVAAGCERTPPVSVLTPLTAPDPPGPTAPAVRVFLDQIREFGDAIAGLGTRIHVDFEDIDARPITGTIVGRTPFNGRRYTDRGIVFANPNAVPLFIAPAGLPWNPTNSLSIGRFPFDSLDQRTDAPFIEDDDLVVTFEPGCSAAAFSVIDKGSFSAGDFVELFDADGALILRAAFPQSFLGVVSRARPIARIVISEAADDVDDVTYDDLVCVR